ncbi:MAG: glycoside hydrolase family 18 protein [Magnetospirillum sp. WYHS-4]
MTTDAFVVYADKLSTWYPPEAVLNSFLNNAGSFNHLLLSFWTRKAPLDVALAWSNGTFPQNAIDQFHQAGIKVLVSAGGATEEPITADPTGGAAYGRAVAEFAKTYRLDGVDFDIEDIHALQAGTATQWLADATRAVKDVLPDAVVTHAPQAPYFMGAYASNYLQVDEQVGDLIDFYNIQFYNQMSTGYDSCTTLIDQADGWATGTAVKQLIAAGIPQTRIVIGKPMTPGDAAPGNTGYMPVENLVGCLDYAIHAGSRPRGVMTWQWNTDNLGLNATWSQAVAGPF